jgi:transcriptional regulator with XRE-family HTH domain
MDEPTPKTIVARNLYALLQHERMSVNAWAKKYGLVQTTINRILRETQSPTMRNLETITEALNARGWDLSPWQLMVPGFLPDNPPVLLDASAAETKLYGRIKESLREIAQEPGGDRWVGPGPRPRRRYNDR